MASAAQLHWYRTESHASPLGYELRAEYRGRTWRMYRLADGSWRVRPTDRPQQEKTFWKPEEARKWASQAAMTNPGRKRNPQGVNMAKKNPRMTLPGHWKVQFTTSSGRVTDSPQFGTKKAAEAFRDEILRTTGRYHEKESAQLYEYMDNGTYRPRGKPKVSHAGKNPTFTQDRQPYGPLHRLEVTVGGVIYIVQATDEIRNGLRRWELRKYTDDRGTTARMASTWIPREADANDARVRSVGSVGSVGSAKNPAPCRRKNPGRSKNGAGLGSLIGSTIGAVAGFGAGSVPLAALGSLAGGTVGGYFGAPKDRKKRGAAGGAIGGALLGPVGAGIGGYVGGTKADKDYGGRRSNPGRKALREQNPSDDKITGPNEDGVYSFRGYQFEIYGPSHGSYGVTMRDPQGNETELSAGSKAYALKEAIHFIKVATDPDYRNNPGSACGCSHRAASLSRRISNP